MPKDSIQNSCLKARIRELLVKVVQVIIYWGSFGWATCLPWLCLLELYVLSLHHERSPRDTTHLWDKTVSHDKAQKLYAREEKTVGINPGHCSSPCNKTASRETRNTARGFVSGHITLPASNPHMHGGDFWRIDGEIVYVLWQQLQCLKCHITMKLLKN